MPNQNQINPLALDAGDLIRLLRKSGCPRFSDDTLQNLVEAGLPLNADGSVNLVETMAWLLKEVQGYAQSVQA